MAFLIQPKMKDGKYKSKTQSAVWGRRAVGSIALPALSKTRRRSKQRAAEIKTEREPPRPRSDVQLVSYFMMKKAILTRGSPLPDSLIAASERGRMYVCVPF
jgi:hypothetical protein